MNVGTIVQAAMLKVRLVRGRSTAGSVGHRFVPGRSAGEAGCWVRLRTAFLETLSPGDTFLFGGEILALQAIVDDEALCAPRVERHAEDPFLCGFEVPRSRPIWPSRFAP